MQSTHCSEVKNRPSRRVVPLHKEIAADVLARAANGHEWLFPAFPHDKRGKHARSLQAAFNGRRKPDGSYVGFLRGVLGIMDPNLTLHSTRHSFIDAMRRVNVPEDMLRRIVGHGKPDVNSKYGRGAGLVAMAKVLEAVEPLA